MYRVRVRRDLMLAKKVGLKPERSIPFFNSGIECRLLEYKLYEGRLKVKKAKASAPVSS